jgi:pilus assembly protein CpaC
MIRKAALLPVLAGVLAGAGMLMPVASHAGDETSSVIKVDAGSASSTQLLALPIGRSAVVDLPVDARDVLVTNPQIAEAVLRTPRRIFVLGLKSGVTDAMFFDSSGRRLLALNIRVDQNVSALADTINRILPGSQVKVEAINDSVILTGTVTSAADADKAVRIAAATVSNPQQVLNMLSIAGEEQVMLKVRIVEMERDVIKQLGVDWHALINQAGSTQFLLNTATSYGINGALLGGITTGAAYNSANNQISGNL